MKWRAVCQNTPYQYTSPWTVLVEAETRDAAATVVADHLTRHGCTVDGRTTADALKLGDAAYRAFLDAFDTGRGNTVVRSIDPYEVAVEGRVLETGGV